jgi:hypothetical protein
MFCFSAHCGKCGRACYVFVPRRKRPSGRNRSEVPVSPTLATPLVTAWHLFQFIISASSTTTFFL